MIRNFKESIDYEVISNSIVIFNLRQDGHLTIDKINTLLMTMKEDIPDIATRRILYQNYWGRFDELVIAPTGEFITLRPLNATTPKKAIEISQPNAFH